MDFSAEHNGAKNKTTERNKTWILQLEYSSYNKCINCFGKTQQKLPDLKNCQPFLSGPIWIFSNFLVSSSNFTSSGTEWIFKGFYGHFSTIPSQLWPPVVIACYIIHPRTRHWRQLALESDEWILSTATYRHPHPGQTFLLFPLTNLDFLFLLFFGFFNLTSLSSGVGGVLRQSPCSRRTRFVTCESYDTTPGLFC